MSASRKSGGCLRRAPAGAVVIRSCNEMQEGRLEAGGVLKTAGSARKGVGDRLAGCDNEVTARDKRVVTEAGRGPRGGEREEPQLLLVLCY